ncbi:MAG: LamG-like jellyroll fold domain-containing protein [Verrucomicrobiaceae bacterium]
MSSLNQLIPYLDDDNANVVMTPGTYRITPADVTSGLFPSTPLLNFSGHNSTFDFSGVTIEVETEVFRSFGNVDVVEVGVFGEDLVLKNLTLIDIGTARPQRTALGMVLDGRRNRVEGFSQTIRGSYPYGYGDIFGKGAGYVVKHFKHSAILVRGDSNHLLNCDVFHRAYGHGIFCQGSLDAVIEGCYVEGEMRSSDEVLAEAGTGTHADVVNFETDWAADPVGDPTGPGYTLQAGWMFSLQEDGIRAYNTGPDPDGVTRNTRNLQVIDCTVKNMRSGVTIGFCDNTKYVEGCVSLGCENGFWVGTEGQIVECAGDAQFGPLLENNYQNDRDSVVDLTVLDSGAVYGDHPLAYIGGNGHNITLRQPAASVNQNLEIMVNGIRQGLRQFAVNPQYNDFSSNNVVLNNLTNYPVVLGAKSTGTSGQSGGMVTDNGTSNGLSSATISGCGGFSIGKTIEAEDFCGQSGVVVESGGGGIMSVGMIEDGDWIRFDDVFFGVGPDRVEARVAGGTGGGTIEVRLGGVSGTLIGTCEVAGSAVGETWVTRSAELTEVQGLHDLYLVFTGESGVLLNLDSLVLGHGQSDAASRKAESLVGCWKFDEGAGLSGLDSSGMGHHGTLTSASWVPGYAETALDFDGGGDKVSVPSAAFSDIDNEVTIAMWVYGAPSQPLEDSVFYAENSSNGRVFNIHLPYSNSSVYWDAGNSGGYDRIQKAAAVSQFEGQWNHWVFTKNATEGTMKAYHNGVLFMAGIGETRPMDGVDEATIGGRIGNSSYSGMIDEVKLYRMALTESEVGSLYEGYALNTPPVAMPASLTMRSGTVADITLTVSDEIGDSLTYTVVSGPANGVLSGTAPNLSYTPGASFSGNDSFSYQANDGTYDSNTATVSITVWEGQLLAHWALNETSGTSVMDSSGNGHHGTLVSGSWVDGIDRGALDFVGGNTGVSLPASAFAGISDQVTLSMWAFGDAALPQDTSVFYAVNSANDRVLNVHLPWSNSKVYWDAGSDAGYDRILKDATPAEIKGQWNHWVFSKDASSGVMKIHLNGVLWSSGSDKSRLISGITAATIGSQISGVGYQGMVDEVKLFNYAMTDVEVGALYQSSPFVFWVGSFAGLSDSSWGGDPDKDNIATGMEYVLNGDPGVTDYTILPMMAGSGNDYVCTFTRRAESAQDTVQIFEYSPTLDGVWTEVNITGTPDPEVTIGPEVNGLETVTVTISNALTTYDRLFGRLRVE